MYRKYSSKKETQIKSIHHPNLCGKFFEIFEITKSMIIPEIKIEKNPKTHYPGVFHRGKSESTIGFPLSLLRVDIPIRVEISVEVQYLRNFGPQS
jgi:hypothetical protein